MLQDDIQFGNDINNDFNGDEFDYPSRLTSIFVLVISLVLIGMDVLSLYYSYDYIKEASATTPDFIFEQCIKYRLVSEIFFTVFATLVGLSAALLAFLFILNLNLSASKLLHAFLYYNYFIFGPFLLGSSILGFLNFTKVGLTCEGDNPSTKTINLSMILCLIIIFLLGSVVTAAYTTLDIFTYFTDSIKFNKDGNFLIGKIFWKIAFARRREELDNLNNNGNINNNGDIFHERNE